jgi:AcrR family transcriptional regulator
MTGSIRDKENDRYRVVQSGGLVFEVRTSGSSADQSHVEPDRARERILDAAQELFAVHGFDATPTARIAARASVPKGLLFYYFPKKPDLLRALLAERLPQTPLSSLTGVTHKGDLSGSLLRLARRLGLGEHESVVLRTIIFREAGTHPEVREHIAALRGRLLELTEQVLDGASPQPLDPRRRRQAAQTFVAVMLDEANSRRFGAPVPDVAGAARIISDGVLRQPPSVASSPR